MSWAKVDDGWWSHPKVLELSLEARGLWVSVLSWSCAQRRDVVPVAFVRMLDADRGENCAAELVHAGLWVTTDGGWRIHDWDDYQELSLSEKRSQAGRKGGIKSGQTRSKQKAKGSTTTNQNGSNPDLVHTANDEAGTRPGPAQPSPSRPRAAADFASSPTEDEIWAAAVAKAERKQPHTPGDGLAKTIYEQDRDELIATILEERRIAAARSAIDDCLACDPNGFAWRDVDGNPVGHADPDADTAVLCTHGKALRLEVAR